MQDCSALILDVSKCLADLCLDLVAELKVVCEKLLHGFASLCELAVPIAEP